MNAPHFQVAERKFLEGMSWIDKNNDYAEAQKLFLSIIEEFPDFPNPYAVLGFIYSNKLNNPSQAEAFYKRGLEADPAYSPLYYNYASFLQYELRHEELEKLLEQMKTIPGVGLADIYFQYGLMREYQKKYKESLKYFRLVIAETANLDLINAANQGIGRVKLKKSPLFYQKGPNESVTVRILPVLIILTIAIIIIAILGGQ